MLKDLAPIGLSTYGRPQHLVQTIKALKKNTLAPKSELFIFSDAPKLGDEDRVAAVRNYIRTFVVFMSIHIIERENNDRVANSRGGLEMLLDRYGKVVFLAEDIVTAPSFLAFMNEALLKYEKNDRIFNVSGYTPPINFPTNYDHDVFFLRRISAWGFGIWKDRFEQLGYMSPEEYELFASNKEKVKNFVRAGGTDLMLMLKADAYGEIDAGDVKMMYAQFKSDQYTVYPTISLVENIGHDGTGVHCDNTDKFDVALSDKSSFRFPDELTIDRRIVRSNYKFRSEPFSVKKLMRQTRGLARDLLRK
jgi:hypothetical protein